MLLSHTADHRMETLTSFQSRRMDLADKLRGLRERAGLSGKEFAAALGWGNSKVSKIETGKQTPSDVELIDWLTALGVSGDEADVLHAELRDVRVHQIEWRRQLRAGHRARQQQDAKSEREASVIRATDVAAVPGLLQTPDYARAIFTTQSTLLDVPDDVEASVRARMERQRLLYEGGPDIEILIGEAALRHPVGSPAVMAAQIDRLTSALGLPGVRIGLLPLGRQLPYVPWHGFWIVDDTVFIENITAEVRVVDEVDVAVYHRLADALWTVAVEGDEARALLSHVARDLA
ncbi:MAG TPA: helix-turn-helix transcriptional regulator [Pseudonocardiaceae bacterium]|jgi:transcriptional regulator with XRE-family HTH domain|nr:helix-turn-helix transcriptional regulator [Pseudonocardiaceae bacterium]